MSIKFKNKLGEIEIDKSVIERVTGLATIECYGVVGMAAKNVRDGLIHLLKKEHITKGVEIKFNEEDNLIIELHIIVEYGTNITAICETLTSTVDYHAKEFLGIECKEIHVSVDGIRVNN